MATRTERRSRRTAGEWVALSITAFMVAAAILPGFAAASSPPTTIGVGSLPLDLAYDSGNHLLYVVNYNSGNVSIINTTTNKVVANPDVGSIPHHIAYDPANGYVYVPNYGTSNISVLSGTAFLTNLSSKYAPFGVIYDSNVSDMVVSVFSGGCSSGLVQWISSTNGVTNQNLGTQNGLSDALAWDGANGDIFVGSQPWNGANCSFNPAGDAIEVLSSATHVAASISVPNSDITSIAYDPANGEMYASNSAANVVYAISSTTLAIVATIGVGVSPNDLAYDATNGDIDTANMGSSNVSLISSSTNKVVANVAVGASPYDLAYNPSLKEMFVTNSGSANVSAISSSTLKVVANYNVDVGPEAIVYVSANSDMYNVDFTSSTVTVTPNSVAPPPGPTWHTIGPQVPGARFDAAMTYINSSSPNQEYIVVGGLATPTGAPLGDTWLSTAPGTWVQVCPVGGCAGGPPPLWGASIAYGDGWVILFGGCTTPAPCSAVNGVTYSFNIAARTWTALAISGPPARYDASMAAVPNQNVAILFGGRNAVGTVFGDTWEISDIAGSFVWGVPTAPGSPPTASYGGSMTYDLNDPTNQMVFFGGASSPTVVNALTYVFKGFTGGSVTSGSWSGVSTATTPPARWGASMTYFGQGSRSAGTGRYVLMFGGIDTATTPNKVYADTWYFTGGNWHSLSPSTSPSARYDAGMAYSWPTQSAFLYGGYDPVAVPPTVDGDGWLWY